MNHIELCDAFIRISKGVWHWMRRARRVVNPSLAKHASPWGMQLRETTLTDYVVLRLLEECSPIVSVFTFIPFLEAKTGADMEMWITDGSYWLGLRIQCKISDHAGQVRELHYKRNGQYQSDILIRSAQIPGCFPIYLLFVGPPYKLSPYRCPCYEGEWPYGRPCYRRGCLCGATWGNWWLSAYIVKKKMPEKHLSRLADFMTPWHCIFCCPLPILPNRVSVSMIHQHLVDFIFYEDEQDIKGIEPVQTPPRYVQLARAGDLPRAEEELRRLLEGREMQHLVIIDLAQLEE